MHDHVVHGDAPGRRPAEHLFALGRVIAEVVEAQGPVAAVHIGQGLVQGLVALHRQDRAKDLLLHHLHVVGGIEDQGRGDLAMGLLGKVLALGLELDHPSALGPGVVDIAGDPVIVPLGDDRGVVGIVLDRREHGGDGGAGGVHKALHLVLRRQDVVGSQADLARIECLAVHDPGGGHLQVGRLAQDHRALAAELQGDRHQVLGRGTHDVAGDRGRPREDQVVEGQAREGLAHLRPAGDHGDLLLGESAREHRLHQFGGGRRELRGLDHGPVAGREDAREGRKGQVDGEVPGADHPHHALGLEAHLGLGAEQAQDGRGRLALLGAHPLGEIVPGVLQRADGAGNVGEGCSLPGPGAEVGIEGLLDGLAVLAQEADAAVDAFDPQGRAGLAVAQMGRLLALENGLHVHGDPSGLSAAEEGRGLRSLSR